MVSIIRSTGTEFFSLLYLNSRRSFDGLKYMYSVISVIVDSLPGNTKNRESTRSWTARVRLVYSWAGRIHVWVSLTHEWGVWPHSCMSDTTRLCVCDMTHRNVCDTTQSYACDTNHLYLCDMTYSCVRDMTRSYVCDMNHSNTASLLYSVIQHIRWHNSFMCA